MAFKMPKGKEMFRLVLLGTGVVIMTPIVAGIIPPIFALGNVVTLGTALSAGISAFVTSWILMNVFKMK